MTTPNKPGSWSGALAVYSHPRVLGMMFLGFSAGLPYMLVFGNIATWLTDIRISIAIVGYFAWISLTYVLKMFLAPIVDVVNIPLLSRVLGHRRSWILVAQIGVAIGIYGLSSINPHLHLLWFAWFALLLGFFAAIQDIVIDAYRIEAVSSDYQAAMASTYQFGYRFALVISGAGVLLIAEFTSWNVAYFSMAILMLVNIITILVIKEPETKTARKSMPVELVTEYLGSFNYWVLVALYVILFIFSVSFFAVMLAVLVIFPVFILVLLWAAYLYRDLNLKRILAHWFLGTVVGPLVDFIYRYGFKLALLILALVMTYRVSDLFMGFMAPSLYLEVGFTKFEIALYTKMFGVVMTLIGTFLGGILVVRFGVMRILLLGASMVAATTLLFSALALTGKSTAMLIALIIGDNISGGLAATAFIAYLSALVNRQYTATQYALLSSLMLFVGKFFQGFSGGIVGSIGFAWFFSIAALSGIPAVLLILYLMKLKHAPKPPDEVLEPVKEKANEPTRSNRSRVILTYSVIPALLLGLSVLVLFETGAWQFNNPDQAHYPVRGITLDGAKSINWDKLRAYAWDKEGKKTLDYVYLKTSISTPLENNTKEQKQYLEKIVTLEVNQFMAVYSGKRHGIVFNFNLCRTGREQAQDLEYQNIRAASLFPLIAPVFHIWEKGRLKERAARPVLPAVVTVDLVGNCPLHLQPPEATIAKELNNFVDALRRKYAKTPYILASEKSYDLLVAKYLPKTPLWIKSTMRSPRDEVSKLWTLWQYTNKGLVDGIKDHAEISVFRGTEEEFLKWGR